MFHAVDIIFSVKKLSKDKKLTFILKASKQKTDWYWGNLKIEAHSEPCPILHFDRLVTKIFT